MNVSEGDLAIIAFSIRPQNVGRIVKVAEYIGKFDKDETFDFRGMVCQALVADHFWWIEADDLDIQLGPSPRAYIADSWLRKIKPSKDSVKEKESNELDVNAII